MITASETEDLMPQSPQELISERVHDVRRRFETHEAVCAQRYLNIESAVERVDERVSSTNNLLLTVAGATMLQLFAVIGYLLTQWRG